jgi:hypothetical protein
MKEEQGRQENEKTEIFGLKHEDEKRLHPYALKRFNDWKAEVFNEVPQLEQLTIDEFNAHINTYLNETEKDRAAKHKQNMLEWLRKCTNIVEGYSPYPYDRWVISDMSGLRSLIQKAYKARAEKLEAERKEKEDSERWCSAYIAIKPPDDDAKKYLNDEEYEKFEQATWKAVDIYKEKGEDYLNYSGTFDYRHWLYKIDYRKEEEQIRNDAQVQAQAFRTRLDQGLKELGKMLSPEKEDPAVIFKGWCSNHGENRYLGEPFTDILASDDKNRKWTQGYIPAAEDKLKESIPGEIRDFILTKPTVAFFSLPSANYSHCGVPCLDFYFDVFAVVTITVLAQAGQKVFNGYKFIFLTNLREPELLGFYQITITPNEPDFWQSIPISIIRALIDGNPEPPGTTILERTDELTMYEVKKFKEDICAIHISFERYCRSLRSFEKMRELGIIKERTAEILELPRSISINYKDSKSKKAKAFALFSHGNRPGAPEVKSLGIKPKSAYRYYQDWKKEATVGNNRIKL